MDKFIYKKISGITVLSSSMTEFKYKKHSHMEYCLGVTLRGVQQYNLEGNLISSYKNGVMLINPEQSHDGMAYDENGIDYVMVYIEPTLFMELLAIKEKVRFSVPTSNNSILKQKILNLSYAILNECDEAFYSELLLSITDCFSKSNILEKYKMDKKAIKKIKDMIYCNLGNVLKLDDISEEFGLSKFQFIRFFKNSTGISPYQYFLNSKILLAKNIIEREKDIYLAVAECGFVDLTHLNKHFKKTFGITAFEYLSYVNKN